jgi:hypothetical protein
MVIKRFFLTLLFFLSPLIFPFFISYSLAGTGVFIDSGQSLSLLNTEAVALGDLDGDSDLDAFTANYNQSKKVWLNDGAGNFAEIQSLTQSTSNSVALGDVDGDGDLDAFIGNRGNEPDKLWLNNGSGNFSDSGQQLGATGTEAVALGDADGDGDLDAFVVNFNEQGNLLWLNDGSGNFSDSGQSLGSFDSTSITLGDVDGDGDLDALIGNYNQPNKVWLNDGSGNFSDSGQELGGGPTEAFVMGDVDGDGDLDAFEGNWSSRANRVWLNDGSGNFSDSGQRLGTSSSAAVALGDVNGDGNLDAFVGNYPDLPNKVWLNDGSGNFSDSGQTLGSFGSIAVVLGDLDNDNDLDAFVGNYPAQPNKVWLNVEPDISVSSTSYPFSDVVVGNISDPGTISVSNEGGAVLTGIAALIGADAAEFNITSGNTFTLDSGESQDVVVEFSPASSGTKEAALQITSNDPDSAENLINVSLTGTGVLPDIAVVTTPIDFGDVEVGNTSPSEAIRVTNEGTAALAGNATLAGSYPGEFTITGGDTINLDPGAFQDVMVRFNPTSVGNKSATLQITNDDPDESQVDVDLMGRGITPEDNDGDGLPDFWENQIIYADLDDDIYDIEDVNPGDDFDNDLLTNQQEYGTGSSPINARPDKPILDSPVNAQAEVQLTTLLSTFGYFDDENDAHALTHWQISRAPFPEDFEPDPADLVLDLVSDEHLTIVDIVELILSVDTDYWWRARFSDTPNEESDWSDWSDPFMFTTIVTTEEDPNYQVVDCSDTDIFGDDLPPAGALCAEPTGGGSQFSLECANCASIEALTWMDFPNYGDIKLPLGLINFRVVLDPLDPDYPTAMITYRCSELLPDNAKWYKYNPITDELIEFYADFLPDGRTVLIEVTDGVDGEDMDYIANGIVIDPSGPGVSGAGGGGGGGGGGCFITSSTNGIPVSVNMLALKLLLGFVIISHLGLKKMRLKN